MRGAKNYFIFLVLCMILVFFCFTWFGSSVESWLIVDAVPRHYVGVSDAGGDLLSAYWLQFPAGSVSITNEVATVYYAGAYQANLLNGGNTQWVFCSNSDTDKGIATMAYDAGAKGGGDVPDPGDSGTGGTSGGTCKVISVTVSTGSFATNDATGTIEIGASAGRFHDNETVTFTDGETVVVNHPNSAAGVDTVQNGEFSTATTGWTAIDSAIIASVAGGHVGNCLKITEGGAASPKAIQIITVQSGKQYFHSFWHKDIDGTANNPQWALYDLSNSAFIKSYTSETANAAWTQVTWYFTAPTGCTQVRLYLVHSAGMGDADSYYFDEVSCYEVTPCCTAVSGLAFDGWNKDGTAHLYRVHNDGGTNTKDGSFYSLQLVVTAAADYLNYPGSGASNAKWYQQYAGRVVCFGCWLKTSTASHARLRIYDGTTETYSSYHTGGGGWEWIEVSATISASPSLFNARVYGSSASLGSIYVSQPMLVYGSSIGQGNYIPEADKMIYFENDIASQTFDGKSFSDVSITEINLESDSLACIGKGVKAVRVFTRCNDSGSAGTDCYFHAGYDISAAATEFVNSPYGRANDTHERREGIIPCNSSGKYEYQIDATGGSTFDIGVFKYIGGEWR